MTLLPSAATYTACEQAGYTARISKVMEGNREHPSCIRTLERVFSTLCHYSMCLALASAAFSHALIVAPPRIRSGRMPAVQGTKDKLQLSFDCTASSTSPNSTTTIAFYIARVNKCNCILPKLTLLRSCNQGSKSHNLGQILIWKAMESHLHLSG